MCPESVFAPAALNDQQKLAALTIFAAYARAREGRGAPRFNNCVAGAPISLISQLTRVREERGGDEGAGGRREVGG